VGNPVAEYVSVSPSGSVALIVKLSDMFSFTDLFPITAKTGGLLTLPTEIVIVSESFPPLPSLTLKVIV